MKGGRRQQGSFGYFSLPLMVRPNSLLAIGSNDQKPDYDYANDVTLHLFELGDQCSVTASVYSVKDELELLK